MNILSSGSGNNGEETMNRDVKNLTELFKYIEDYKVISSKLANNISTKIENIIERKKLSCSTKGYNKRRSKF